MSRHHRNPYRIRDERNLFEVTANSSHPELLDSKRIWHFKGHTFTKPEHLEQLFKSEGLNPDNYWFKPVIQKDGYSGHNEIHIIVCERIPKDEQHEKFMSYREMRGK